MTAEFDPSPSPIPKSPESLAAPSPIISSRNLSTPTLPQKRALPNSNRNSISSTSSRSTPSADLSLEDQLEQDPTLDYYDLTNEISPMKSYELSNVNKPWIWKKKDSNLNIT